MQLPVLEGVPTSSQLLMLSQAVLINLRSENRILSGELSSLGLRETEREMQMCWYWDS